MVRYGRKMNGFKIRKQVTVECMEQKYMNNKVCIGVSPSEELGRGDSNHFILK